MNSKFKADAIKVAAASGASVTIDGVEYDFRGRKPPEKTAVERLIEAVREIIPEAKDVRVYNKPTELHKVFMEIDLL